MTVGSDLLCQDDVDAFERDGVVCIRGAVSAPELDDLTEGIDDIVRGLTTSAAGYDISALREQIFDRGEASPAYGQATQYDLTALSSLLLGTGAKPLVDDIGEAARGRGRFLVDTSTWLRSSEIRRVALDSNLPELASVLLRSSKVNYCDDQVFVKEPGTKDRTAFHQDYTYFNLTGSKGCVMWICVDPATQESGVPAYIRGSHRWRREFKPNVFVAQTSFPGASGDELPDIEGHLSDYDIVGFATQPGDIIVHHFLTVHGASGNRTSKPRRAISLRYAGDDVRYCKRPGTPPQPYHNHHLHEGDRLDCEQFPVVWPRPFPGFALAPVIEQYMSI